MERLLGRGGMGLVVAARHLHLGEPVAIKLLLPGSPVTRGALARFLREGKAAARMRSEHVARVHDAGILDTGEPYLVLEYLEGVDLRTLVKRRGPLPVGTAVAYVLQVCEALAEAHALGIVHRDLKPANLFLTTRADGSSVVKVIDFGISKIASDPNDEESAGSLTAHNAAMGTPGYMAPEQMRSARAADPRADIWSLGAALYGLLTGASPFPGETMIEVYDRILRGPPSLRSAREEAPAELEEVVSRCLRMNPAERFEDVGQLAAALAQVVPPEERLSAERAIRIVGGAEAAGSWSEDAPALDSRVELQLAGTELDPAQATPGLESREKLSEALHRSTETELEPSWADRRRASSASPVPAKTSTAAPETPPEAPEASAALAGPPAEASAVLAGPPAEAPRAAPEQRRSSLVVAAVVLALAVFGGAAMWLRPPAQPAGAGSAGAELATLSAATERVAVPSGSAPADSAPASSPPAPPEVSAAAASTAVASTAVASTAVASTAVASTAVTSTAVAGTAVAGTAVAGTAPHGVPAASSSVAVSSRGRPAVLPRRVPGATASAAAPGSAAASAPVPGAPAVTPAATSAAVRNVPGLAETPD